MDADEIAAREVEELQKERRELQQKLKSQEKKVDYFERAKRLEEAPLLQKAFEEKKVLSCYIQTLPEVFLHLTNIDSILGARHEVLGATRKGAYRAADRRA
jgi:single-stranded DNA-specific DHH superfamily exonuclease